MQRFLAPQWLAVPVILLMAACSGHWTLNAADVTGPDGKRYLASGDGNLTLATATPAATATPGATPTAAPTVTSTPPPADSIAGVPVCPNHNRLLWHNLVERDAANAITCTYGHEHNDDPRLVNNVFGVPGGWWNGGAEQDFGYPWASSAIENLDLPLGKHPLFKWLVRRNLEGSTLNANGWSWTNFRAVAHLLGSGGNIPGQSSKDGFQTQVHSFGLEIRACRNADTTDCGTVRTGGWQDYGWGALTTSAGDQCILPNQFLGAPCQQGSQRRLHGDTTSSRRDFTWYGSQTQGGNGYHVTADIGTIGDAWATVDPSNFNLLDFYPPYRGPGGLVEEVFNGSTYSAEVMGIYVPAGMPGWDDVTGRVNFAGYLDRWGTVLAAGACSAPGLDCVPVQITNMPTGSLLYRDSNYLADHPTPPQPFKAEYDVLVPYQGDNASLIRYPN